MNKEKLKVVWICQFSNKQVREHIKYSRTYYKKLYGFNVNLCHNFKEYAIWNTNAIREFEKFDDICLTVIFPHSGISGNQQHFSINGVNYICFRPEDDNLCAFFKRRLTGKWEWEYKKHRRIVSQLLDEIQPDIVHLIGAEIPAYSVTLLDCPQTIPTITSLQTLMSTSDFKDNYPISEDAYEQRSRIEQMVIKRSDYIALRAENIRKVIKQDIKPDAIFLQMTLAVGIEINTKRDTIGYDFVYFANDVSKAGDDAIEAFAIACKKRPELRLNISGSCSDAFRKKMDVRLQELGVVQNVVFTGPKETHAEVLKQIKHSRFAVLPLKVDLISCTIREAMACGLPVVTTVTPATPSLNSERESILLSEKGDYQAMAENMLRLIDDETLAQKLRQNALVTIAEHYSNGAFMKKWRKAYYEIIDNFNMGKSFSDDIVYKD